MIQGVPLTTCTHAVYHLWVLYYLLHSLFASCRKSISIGQLRSAPGISGIVPDFWPFYAVLFDPDEGQTLLRQLEPMT